jgi:hypothetical protein
LGREPLGPDSRTESPTWKRRGSPSE